jgi:hypothetical protein
MFTSVFGWIGGRKFSVASVSFVATVSFWAATLEGDLCRMGELGRISQGGRTACAALKG